MYYHVNKIIFLLLINISAFSQCTYKELLPFKIGSSKFDITLKTQEFKLIIDDPAYSKIADMANNGWRRFDYLKNDSVYMAVINLELQPVYCFEGKETRMQLYLVNDHLYKTKTIIEYSPNNFNVMIKQYNDIVAVFDNLYQYNIGFKTSNSNEEKIGEGIKFYKVPEEKRSKTKSDYISVGYSIIYKSSYSNYDKKYIASSDVDYYKIQISEINLQETKLTNQGF